MTNTDFGTGSGSRRTMLRTIFLTWFYGFWNWLSNLIKFKYANDFIFSCKETTDSP